MLVGPAAVFFALLLVLPLVVVLIYSFGERAPAGGYAPGFTLANYANLPARGTAFLNTLTLAPLGTLLCARHRLSARLFPGRQGQRALAHAASRARRRAVLDEPAPAHLCVDPDPRKQGPAALPRACRLRGPAHHQHAGRRADRHGLRLSAADGAADLCQPGKARPPAARGLGRSRRQRPGGRFLQVTLPLSLPGVATGSMLVFILLMGEFIIPALLGGGKVFFIGNALVDLFLQSRNWPFGAAVSVALVAIMLVTVVVYMRFVLGALRRAPRGAGLRGGACALRRR